MRAVLLWTLLWIGQSVASALCSPSASGLSCQLASGVSLLVDAWGDDSFRVRLVPAGQAVRTDIPSALSLVPSSLTFSSSASPSSPSWSTSNGNMQATVSDEGTVSFARVSDGVEILRQLSHTVPSSPSSASSSIPTYSRPLSSPMQATFSALPTDHVFGLGQGVPVLSYPTTRTNTLDWKGKTIDFEHCLANEGGAANCIPWYMSVSAQATNTESARGVQFGFLWNMPGFGGVSFQENQTVWHATHAWQLDYFVTTFGSTTHMGSTRSFEDIMSHYTQAVGRTPPLASNLLGYWHSKNAYLDQDAVMDVMAGFAQRTIPVDVLVIDIGGSRGAIQGDWDFDPDKFPDPDAMVAYLSALGTRLMVSVWPGTQSNSASHKKLTDERWVVTDEHAVALPWPIGCDGPQCFMYDASNSAARDYVWGQLSKGYLAHNVSLFWLDASEPQPPQVGIAICPQYKHGTFQQGSMAEVGMAWVQWHTKMIWDGLQAARVPDGAILARSGWAGTSSQGAAVWSGDTLSDWQTLRQSITTGLGAQLGGVAWWTTDIGGYRCPNVTGDVMHCPGPELLVRWFQFGLTCPIFRQHGHRPFTAPWHYGPVAEDIITRLIRQRVAMKPYLREQHDILAATGTPFNRPLWWDFPQDEEAWKPDLHAYMMGSDYLAAPVVAKGARSRQVYLPAGARWQHYYTDVTYEGGQTVAVDTPLEHFPLFRRLSS